MESNSREGIDPPREYKVENESGESSVKNSSKRYGQNVRNYEVEWNDLCTTINADDDLTKLRELAISGDLKVSKFRSIIWNVLNDSLSRNTQNWIEERTEQRKKYYEIKTKYILNPDRLQYSQSISKDDPLSQSSDSLWNQHFLDTELRNLIQQDVVRTNPNIDYYHKENVQEIMTNILFCYARENPKICYRQGMHEILAPLIFVLHCDHQSLCHIQEETNIELDRTLVTVLNPIYIEEDSYHLFHHIMNSLELFYRINDMTISESGQLTNISRDSETPMASPSKKSSEIEVVHQLNLIRDTIFAKNDLHLHNHLLKLEIPLALFGIRWLRLLFGREFPLLDLLVIWDSIFGVGDNLKFTYYIVVAMLIHIRDRLLSNDYTSCLTLLMRYPSNADVSLIIRHALYMCDPERYQCPPNAFVYVINSMKQRQVETTRVYTNISPKSALPSSRKLRDDMRRETAKITKKAHSDDGIVDGYSLDDPEVLKIELQDSYNIMAVSRIKLLQYLSILRKYIPGNQVDELHQTLDGIEELCSLLKPKHQYMFDIIPAPVDVAFEADDEENFNDEEAASSSQRSFPLSVKKLNPSINAYEVPNNRVNKTASQLLRQNKSEVEMDLIRTSTIGCVDLSQYPQENPLEKFDQHSD